MSNGNVTIPAGSNLYTVDEEGNLTLNSAALNAVALAAKNSARTGDPCAPCGSGPGNPCSVTWSISADKILLGEYITIFALGVPPGKRISFAISLPACGKYVVNLIGDSSGQASKRIALTSGYGLYAVHPEPAGDGCVYTPAANTVLVRKTEPLCAAVEVSTNASLCELTATNIFSGGEIYSTACDRAVTVTPRFLGNNINSGGQVQVEIAVANSNFNPVTFTLAPLALPAGLTGTVVIPSVVIEGNQVLRRYFTLTVSSGVEQTVSLVVSTGNGTYLCDGDQYSAAGGQDSLTMLPPASAACDLRIETFVWNPASILNGGVAQLQLVLKNYGSATVTSVNMPAVAGGGGFSGAPLVISGVTIAPGATHSVSSTGNINHTATTPQTFSATIPAGHITYTCNGNSVAIQTSRSANISVAASTIAAGYCAGTLYWEKEDDYLLNVVLEDAVPNTLYTYTVSNALSTIGSVTTNSSGDARFDLPYSENDAGFIATIVVTGPPPGNCQFPELTITLPVVNDGIGTP